MGKTKTIFVRPEHAGEIVDVVDPRREAAHIKFGKGKNEVVKGINGLPIKIEKGSVKVGDTLHLTAKDMADTLGWVKLIYDGGPEKSSDRTTASGIVANIERVAAAMGDMARSPGLKQMAIYWATGIPIGMVILMFLQLLNVIPSIGP